jgi:nitrate reductase NapE component
MRFTRFPKSSFLILTPVLIFGCTALLIDRQSFDGSFETLLGVAYFVFGLLLAFALENARTRRARITELLKSGDADLASMYQLLLIFGEPVRDRFRGQLDAYLQAEIDYALVDFDRSGPQFDELFQAVCALRPSEQAEIVAYDHLLELLTSKAERRRQIEAAVGQRISRLEWAALAALAVSVWLLIVVASAGGGPFIVLGTVLIASLSALMLVLWQQDQLRWQESSAIWHPLHRLFLSLDLLPYYPRNVVELRGIRPPSRPYRLADYPNEYPDMTGKVVTTIL